jgi:2',3'-cyclic-nucleotide 2'-phosphodiesterase (5'-nucleotidase family)
MEAAGVLPSSTSDASPKQALLSLLTINDVYEFETIDGIGGFGPTTTWLHRERSRATRKGGHSLFFVCGDFMSASRLGNVHKGAHMVHLFNEMGVDYVVFGNHEFDFGNEVLRTRIKESKFKWLGTNVLTPEGKPFGGSSWIDVREYPLRGNNGDDVLRVGLFGVCTLATPNLSFPDADVTFAPIIASAKDAVKALLEEHKVDVIIAVTHISLPQDKELATKVPEIDIIIGGHDHVPYCLFEHKVFIMKVGQNAEYLGRIDINYTRNDLAKPNAQGREKGFISLDWKVKANRRIPSDERIDAVIRSYTETHDEALRQPIATVVTALDSTQTRSKESTMANFLTDALCETFNADLAIINGGFIRGNRVYEQGYSFTLGDVEREFPFPKKPFFIETLGKEIWEALETGVRAVEERAGFFLHLSKGWTYSFDPRKPPGQRIISVQHNGEDLALDRSYRVVITEYMRGGGDGFESLKRGTVLKTSDLKISEILTRYIIDKKEIAPVLEGRVVYIH